MDDDHTAKRALRATAAARRARLPDRAGASRRAVARLTALAEYRQAHRVLWFASLPDEVYTHGAIARALQAGKDVALPYCDDRDLRLWRLRALEELAPGTWGILEPPVERRLEPGRPIDPAALDLVVVPGVAFDPAGGRLGHGKGYYDRLLARVGPDTALLGLAFDCQVFAAVPMCTHDVRVHGVVTERATYRRSA